MIFSIGNIITILVVLLILLIYRQLDKGNRSLEKVKRYSDRVVKNLSEFIDDKTAEIRNLSIEIQVNLKTGKELLNKIRELETHLQDRADGISEIEDKIKSYDGALKELVNMTGRVDENLKRLHNESKFVDSVFDKIKALNVQLSRVESSIPAIEEKITQKNRESLEKVKEEIEREFNTRAIEVESVVEETEKRVKDFSTYIARLEARRDEMEKESIENLKKAFDSFEVEAKGKKSTLLQEFVASLKRVLNDVEERGREFTKKLDTFIGVAEKKYVALNEDFKKAAVGIKENYLKEIDEKRNEFLEVVKRGESLSDSVFDSLKEQIEGNRRDVSERVEELTVRVKSYFEEIDRDLAEYKNGFDGKLKELDDELGSSFEDVERRLSEYEEEVKYKFEKLESSNVDIEALEQSLREAMDRVTEKVKADFETFTKYLEERRVEEKTKAEEDMDVIRGEVEELERGLAELKSKAYQDVSEKLKVFEDEFFRDLKARSEALEESMKAWQSDFEGKLLEMETLYSSERKEVEIKYANELQDKLSELRASVDSEFGRLESNLEKFEVTVKDRIADSEGEVKSFGESLRREIAKLKEESLRSFNSEIASLRERFGLAMANSERENQVRLQEMRENVDSIVQEIKDNFTAQRDSLIVKTNEERAALKNELEAISEEVDNLRKELDEKTQSSLSNLKQSLDTFQIDFQKKIVEFQGDVDAKITDYKNLLSEAREKGESMQRKLFGKIEDSYKSLSHNLVEIEKKLKDFVAQTKIFDRADSLKVALTNDIEIMREEIDKLKAQRREVEEIESQLGKTRKLAEDVNSKLTRFLSEKRRIDAMEGDFKKLLNISRDIDSKLESVTSSHDVLQEIQAKIRALEDMEKIVESKYERLEKKKDIIESTVEGIDKNFGSLSKIEKELSEIGGDIKDFTERLVGLKEQIEVLAVNKEKADSVIETISKIDDMLEDLETRMEKLQKAREWLARTETRLENIGKQAEEHVRLLESLIKAEGGDGNEDRGAPPVDKRELVVKLAHKGWSTKDIAQATKLSRGEVELILEIAPKV